MSVEVGDETVFRTQLHFRIVMDAMAHPGIIKQIPTADGPRVDGLNPGSVMIAFALLNSDVSFFVSESDDVVSHFIASHTGAKPTSVEMADYIFTEGDAINDLMVKAKKGNLSYPENSATFIVDVEQMNSILFEGALKVALTGPGVEKENVVYIRGMAPEILTLMGLQNEEFPLGVDMMVVDEEGQIICIPRSSHVIVG